ncbi:hydantoinase/oxoprolinase family protein [Arboricoccus pini]|nr:hydantoinase/oxoprolinase family protein [Arboricoccus pini]
MSFRISVDTGGTFTDVVVADEFGRLTVGKALTTPERAFKGLSDALNDAAEALAMDLPALLAQTELFVYGTTRATNAIVTRRGAKTAFLTTEGFPDILVLKEGGKHFPHDFATDYPAPYIPRRHTFEIRERMSSEGTASIPFDEAQARTILAKLKTLGFEAVAVSFIWSIANPAHERRMGELIEEMLPGVPYTLSHALVPILREYRRASASAIDASLKPLMQRHLQGLEEDLRAAGYQNEFLVSTSIGGVMQVAELIEQPIHTAKSGPAMAPVAARAFSGLETLGADAIVCDTGGTTFDVGLVREGELVYSRDTWLGGEWTGHLLGISSVDIRSVGAGGGSIAWIDDGGLFRVGPQSAGSVPGPACYGQGGTQPTVSDAACVLGYFNPDYFLGGRMALDQEAAHAAVSTVAARIGRSTAATAFGIINLASELMIKAIHDITIAEGVNPRESVLVAGGGAAGINIMLIAKELGCEKVLLPKQASALSAAGMQFADIVKEASRSLFTTSQSFDKVTVNTLLASLREELEAFRAGLNATQKALPYKIEFVTDARYASQVWEIEAPLPSAVFETNAEVDALTEAFHATHERLFTLRDEGSTIEFIGWKARLTVMSGIALDRIKPEPPPGVAETARYRPCYFGDDEPVTTRIWKGQELAAGTRVDGPCIIEEPTTTVVVFPGMSAEVTPRGHYLLTCI